MLQDMTEEKTSMAKEKAELQKATQEQQNELDHKTRFIDHLTGITSTGAQMGNLDKAMSSRAPKEAKSVQSMAQAARRLSSIPIQPPSLSMSHLPIGAGGALASVQRSLSQTQLLRAGDAEKLALIGRVSVQNLGLPGRPSGQLDTIPGSAVSSNRPSVRFLSLVFVLNNLSLVFVFRLTLTNLID